MAINKIGNVIIIDNNDIKNESINFDGIVNNTANTWQLNRSVAEKKADTELGKFAENAVITALRILGSKCYYSYDSFRSDDFKMHAPFDGLLIRKLSQQIVDLINGAVKVEGPKLSSKTRQSIRDLGGLTVEVKSTRLAQKYKDRVGFSSYDNNDELSYLLNELLSLDFLTYPFFTRYGNMTFDQYCWFAETHYLHTWKRGEDLREYVKQIELSNASDYYIRVFVDEVNNKTLIMGCIDRFLFFDDPKTHKLILPGKSEIPLYFVKPISCGYSLEHLLNLSVLKSDK